MCQFCSDTKFSALFNWNNPIMLENSSQFVLHLTQSPISYRRAENQPFFQLTTVLWQAFLKQKQVLWPHGPIYSFLFGTRSSESKHAWWMFVSNSNKRWHKTRLKQCSKLPTCEVDFNLALESPDNSLIVVHKDNQFHELLAECFLSWQTLRMFFIYQIKKNRSFRKSSNKKILTSEMPCKSSAQNHPIMSVRCLWSSKNNTNKSNAVNYMMVTWRGDLPVTLSKNTHNSM